LAHIAKDTEDWLVQNYRRIGQLISSIPPSLRYGGRASIPPSLRFGGQASIPPSLRFGGRASI
jgi:hypothetical protein